MAKYRTNFLAIWSHWRMTKQSEVLLKGIGTTSGSNPSHGKYFLHKNRAKVIAFQKCGQVYPYRPM